MRTVPQKPGLGYEGWEADIKKRLLRSFLTNGNLENFNGKVKDVANSRCLCGYDYIIIDQRGNVGYDVFIFCVRLLQVCSFYFTGQFQSLRLYERATSMALTLFRIIKCQFVSRLVNIIWISNTVWKILLS